MQLTEEVRTALIAEAIEEFGSEKVVEVVVKGLLWVNRINDMTHEELKLFSSSVSGAMIRLESEEKLNACYKDAINSNTGE